MLKPASTTEASPTSADRADADARPAQRRSGTVSLADIRRAYRRYARGYDWLFGAVLADGRRKVLREVSALQPQRILELGVGTGLMLDDYPAQAEVLGIDVSEDMLAIARERIRQRGLANTRVELADGERLAYPDGSFDCVVLPYVLSVTPSPAALAREAIRLCAPGGRIIIVNHFSGSRFWRVFEALAAPLAARIGFHSRFSFDEHVLAHPWQVERRYGANLMGLSQVVVLTP